MVIRIRIRSEKQGFAEEKGQHLLDYFDEKPKLQSFPVMTATTTAGDWTGFINANQPSTRFGDLETFAAASNASMAINQTELCGGRNPIGIHCRAVDGRPYFKTLQTLDSKCDLKGGLK